MYKELQTRVDKVAYFGIPKDMNNDGMLPTGSLCTTQKRFDTEPDPDCRPMHKTFFLQVCACDFLNLTLIIVFQSLQIFDVFLLFYRFFSRAAFVV